MSEGPPGPTKKAVAVEADNAEEKTHEEKEKEENVRLRAFL